MRITKLRGVMILVNIVLWIFIAYMRGEMAGLQECTAIIRGLP